jgi:hypothetical protein
VAHWNTVANLTGPTGPTGPSNSWRTTFASFTVPAVGSTVAVTVASTADFIAGQYHLLIDGTNYVLMTVTSIASLVVTYTNQATPGGAVSGTMGAGRVYMVSHASALATATLAGLMPPYDNATIGITSGKLAVLAIPESAVTSLATDLAAKAPTSRTISAGDGLSGGGDLSANRTMAVDGTVGRTGGTSHYYDYDDFLGPATLKFCLLGNGGGTGAVSAVYQTDMGAGHPGVIQLAPSTTANNGAYLYCGPVFLNQFTTITWRARVSNNFSAGIATQLFVGLASSAALQISSTQYYAGLYLQLSVAANWRAQCRNLTSFTDQDAGVAGTAVWVDLKIVASATSVAFYVNGSLTNTIATNIPPSTQLLYPCCFINAASNTADFSMFIDSVEIDIDTGVSGRYLKTVI